MAKNNQPSESFDESGSDLGRPLEDELLERVQEEGTTVFSVAWDSDSPNMGADTEYVCELGGKLYYLSNSAGSYGPYSSLDEALDQHGLLTLNSTTSEIDCKSLAAQEILGRCHCEDDLRAGAVIRVNGEEWAYHGAGQFRPVG